MISWSSSRKSSGYLHSRCTGLMSIEPRLIWMSASTAPHALSTSALSLRSLSSFSCAVTLYLVYISSISRMYLPYIPPISPLSSFSCAVTKLAL